MSARRRQTLSPSLFPFLAVLVCTLGTLILLLALVAQNTSDAAQQLAESQVDDSPNAEGALTVGDVELLVEEEEFRLSELVSFREAQTGDLENRRNQLAHVEDHMRRIRQRLQEINQAMEQAMAGESASAATVDEVNSLKQQLESESLVVKKLREEIQTAKPRFVIVPHQGPNGTDRRPIYLECTADGVMIWPEGVAINRWQLENSSSQANPLDDALRAARYHAMQEYGDTIPPYPMLLVRPDGVDTYYAARAAMLDWDDQFGYELVPTEINLAYPKPDPSMRQRMEYAVNTAASRITQQASVARSFGGGQGSSSPGMPHGGDGNFENRSVSVETAPAAGSLAAQGSKQPAPVPRLSVSQMDRQGRQSGFRDHRTFPAQTYGRSGSGPSSPISSEAAKRRLERQLQDTASSFDNEGLEGDLEREAATAVEAIAGANAGSDAERTATSDPNSLWLNSPSSDANDSSPALTADGNSDVGGRQNVAQQQNSSVPENPNALGSSAGALTGMNQMGQQEVSQRMKATAPSESENAASQNRREPSPSNATAQRSPGSLVQRSGVDWAVPSSVALARGNEIVRSIRLQVFEDRFVLLPDTSVRASETFAIAPYGGVNSATLLMATAVRDRIERWGAAAPGSRWSPRLKVDVMQGAERRFSELEKLMTGSGLTIERSVYSQAGTDAQGERR